MSPRWIVPSTLSLALALSVATTGSIGVARADRFTPHLDDVEADILEREAALPSTGRTRKERKLAELYADLLKKLGKNSRSLKKELQTALYVIPKLHDAHSDDEDLQLTLDSATEGLREGVLGFLMEVADRLDTKLSGESAVQPAASKKKKKKKVKPEEVENKLESAEDKVFSSYDVDPEKNNWRKKELDKIAKGEALGRKADKLIKLVKVPKPRPGKCEQGRKPSNKESFTATVTGDLFLPGDHVADEISVMTTYSVPPENELVVLVITGYSCKKGQPEVAVSLSIAPKAQGGPAIAIASYRSPFDETGLGAFGGLLNVQKYDEAAEDFEAEYEVTIGNGRGNFSTIKGNVKVDRFE